MIHRLGLLGASGRMGREILSLLSKEFVYGNDRFEAVDLVGRTQDIPLHNLSTRTLKAAPSNPAAQIWIDFSQPEATLELLSQINAPIVIATTGFTQSQFEQVHAYAQRQPVVLASNTSLGMHTLRRFIEALPKQTQEQFDAVLFEEHHKHKKDAPSGSAKTLLQDLKAKQIDAQVLVSRTGETKGLHSIRLVSDFETLEIKHEVQDRRVFAKGALIAAHFLSKLNKKDPPKIYTMPDIYKEN